MILLSQSLVRYFCSVVLVLLLSQVAICVEDSLGIKANQRSLLSDVTTISSTSPKVSESHGSRSDVIESTTKKTVSRNDSPIDLPDRTTKASLSHDNIPSNAGKIGAIDQLLLMFCAGSKPTVISQICCMFQDCHNIPLMQQSHLHNWLLATLQHL